MKYLSFHHSSFCLKILFNVKWQGHNVSDTPLVEVSANCQKLAQLAVFELFSFGNASEVYFY